MAFFCKIKELKPNIFIQHFQKYYYFQISAPRYIKQIPSQKLSDYNNFLSNSRAIYQSRQHLFNSRVRFFAAPVQVKKKDEVINLGRPRLNEEIKAEFLRIVTDEGHSVLPRHEALRRAMSLKLDLVEVDRMAKPPVCKIMDYNREKYKKKVRDKERARMKAAGSMKKGGTKEVRISAKTDLKDLKMKADVVKRLMERGYRVKCTITGSEDQDLSGLLSQLSALIEDVALVESGPKMERNQAHLIVRHVKFGATKKGGKKAIKDQSAASSEIYNAGTTCSDTPAYLGEESDYEDSGLDNDDEVEAPLLGQEESAWSATSVSCADKNFDKMFDVSHDVSGTISSHDKQVSFDREAAASTASNNASRFSVNRVPSFSGPNARPASQESENRYARTATNNTSTMRNPMRFPNNGTQPQPQPQLRAPQPIGSRQGSVEIPPPRSFRLPPEEISQPRGDIQNQSSQASDDDSLKSPSAGFGIFSSTKVDANTRNSASPSVVTRNSGPRMVPGNLNPPTSKSDDPQKSESADKKWGIFSK